MRKSLNKYMSVLALVFGFVMVSAFNQVGAAQLSNFTPHPSASTPTGAHSLFIRKDVANGIAANVRLEAYYPEGISNSEWNNSYLTIGTGGDNINDTHVCDVKNGSANDKWLKVFISSGSGPGTSATFWVRYKNVCSVDSSHENKSGDSNSDHANNIFYGQYPLREVDKPDKDPATNGKFRKLNIVISNESAPSDSGGQRFILRGNNNPKIGPRGEGQAFPILARWNVHTSHETTSLSVPFGLNCQDNASELKRVGIYDSDNGLGDFSDNDLYFKIWDITNSEYVKFKEGSSEGGGYIADSGKRYKFNRSGVRNRDFAGAKIRLQPDARYRMEITGLDPRNAIDIEVPAGTFFGDEDICSDIWKIGGQSYVRDPETNELENGGDILVEVPYGYGKPGYTGGDIIAPEWQHRLRNFTKHDTDRAVNYKVIWASGQKPSTLGNPADSGDFSIIPANVDGDSGEGNNRWARNKTNLNDVVIPGDVTTGTRFCQYIKWWSFNQNQPNNEAAGSRDTSESPACITINRAECQPGVDADCSSSCSPGDSDCPYRYVNMEAEITANKNAETNSQARFEGTVKVSNFPKPENGGWGYDELSSQADAVRMDPTLTTDGTTSTETRYKCPSGYSPNYATSNTSTSCSREVTSCPAGYSDTGSDCSTSAATGENGGRSCVGLGTRQGGRDDATCHVGYNTDTEYNSPSSTEYRYRCAETNSWTGWGTGGSTCRDYYTCPNSGSGSGWATSQSDITCNVWQCQYPLASNASYRSDPLVNQTNAPDCSYRCSGGQGDKAYLSLSWNDKIGIQDQRCFIQPSFSLTCYWYVSGARVNQKTVTVTADGDWCNPDDLLVPTNEIGDVATAELRVSLPSPYSDESWNPASPKPGVTTSGQEYYWRWTKTDDTASTNSVGYSYIKAYGGDVRVGGGVGSLNSTGVCPDYNARIEVNNSGPGINYSGSAAQFGVYARGSIQGLLSGAFNDFSASPSPGLRPKQLAFASQSGTYGGNFGSSGPCYDYTGKAPSDAVVSYANTTIGGKVVNVGERDVRHVKGDVYISGDITYSTGTWVEPADIPVFQLIVEGDIYISSNVHRIDGMVVAVPRGTGTQGGNIYTCANGIGSIPTGTFNACKSQLVVNGSVSAKRLHAYRDCGSLVHANEQEPSVTSGGTDDQLCSSQNHAAEVFNYQPELWIRAAAGPAADRYDSVLSLPPIL